MLIAENVYFDHEGVLHAGLMNLKRGAPTSRGSEGSEKARVGVRLGLEALSLLRMAR